MRYFVCLIFLIFPLACFSETLATCSTNAGQAFYANLGILDSKDSGWKILSAKDLEGTVSLSINSNNNFDILFVDATKAIHSSSEEGADVKLLRHSDNEIVIIVNDQHYNAIEIYDFIKDAEGHNIITILTNEGGDVPFHKSSVESGNCDFINFNISRS